MQSRIYLVCRTYETMLDELIPASNKMLRIIPPSLPMNRPLSFICAVLERPALMMRYHAGMSALCLVTVVMYCCPIPTRSRLWRKRQIHQMAAAAVELEVQVLDIGEKALPPTTSDIEMTAFVKPGRVMTDGEL